MTVGGAGVTVHDRSAMTKMNADNENVTCCGTSEYYGD
jgi:hypothetical protein